MNGIISLCTFDAVSTTSKCKSPTFDIEFVLTPKHKKITFDIFWVLTPQLANNPFNIDLLTHSPTFWVLQLQNIRTEDQHRNPIYVW